MKPVRFWFNGGYADLHVPDEAEDGFQGNSIRLGSDGPVLRISVMRTRPSSLGGPPSAEEALRLTHLASVGALSPLPRGRAVLSHVVPPSEDDPDLIAHVWHLALPAPEAAILVAIFSLEVRAADAEHAATKAAVEMVSAEVRSVELVFFDQPETPGQADIEDA